MIMVTQILIAIRGHCISWNKSAAGFIDASSFELGVNMIELYDVIICTF